MNDDSSSQLDLSVSPDIGEEIAYVSVGRTAGELIEHVAEVGPRVETMPCRARAETQQE